jgi:hypothetical protein
MKKQLLKSALIAVAGVGLLAGSGWAAPLGNGTDYIADPAFGGEPSLQDIIDTSFSGFVTDVVGQQSTVGLWTGVDSASIAYRVTYLFNNEMGSLGVYDPTDTTRRVILGTTPNRDFSTFLIDANYELIVNGLSTGVNFNTDSFGFFYQPVPLQLIKPLLITLEFSLKIQGTLINKVMQFPI